MTGGDCENFMLNDRTPASEDVPNGARPRAEVAPAIPRMAQDRMLEKGQRILCYGCGNGADVAWLKARRFRVHGYDPHPPFGYTDPPTGKYDWVFVVYLMTRLKSDEKRRETLRAAAGFVRPGGRLAIISRRWARQTDPAAQCQAMLEGMGLEVPEVLNYETDDNAMVITARMSGVYQPRNPVIWVDNQDVAAALCAQLVREPVIALDVETTLDEPRTLCTIQCSTADHNWIIDALALKDLAPVKALLENPAVMKVIHNALFEEQVFSGYGIRIINVYDTLPVSRKKHRKQSDAGHKLGDVCERELGVYLDKSLQVSDWTRRPLSPEQIAYAAVDAEVLMGLYRAFNPPEPPQNLTLF
mgnify:CR=1 FL=1